ncbi:hypothetical protein MOBT1_001551 [Malassezia obtusa]|uniref:Adhesin domain-containing protein n=1 Tax=Malassezia obtusa TaxID=76774 RepID=A0AAF0E1K0_9BASI|nr:hypothetical protein MOBT1_001551 [Malassezia obtusa]
MSEYDEPLLDARGLEEADAIEMEEAAVHRPRRYLYAPISYDQAMAQGRPWWDPRKWYVFFQEHKHILDVFRPSDKVRSAFARTRYLMSAAWPRNRMHQSILIVFALWIMVSYVSFTVDETLPEGPIDDTIFSGYAKILNEELHDVQLRPATSDGVVTQNATWNHEYCYSRGKPLRLFDAVGCRSSTSFTLDTMPNKNSMISTDTSFLYIDRGRRAPDGPLSAFMARDGERLEWPAPANVYVRTLDSNSTLAGQHKIEVNVTATFFRPAHALFQHALIAKVERGHGTQGVEIITPPVSRHAHLETHPIEFDVVVSVPRETVAGLEIDAPGATLELFTGDAQSTTSEEPATSDDIPGLFAQLFGDKKPTKHKPPAKPPVLPSEHLFGHLSAQTDVGDITLGSHIRSNSLLSLKSRKGQISLEGRASGREVEIETDASRFALAQGAELYAQTSSHIKTRSGLIYLDERARVSGVKSFAETDSGAIAGSGIWSANLTLELVTNSGLLNASVAVARPLLQNVEYEDFLHSEHGRRVSAAFRSNNGTVFVRYAEHASGVALHSSAESHGNVTVLHAPAYEGPVSVEGRTATLDHAPFPNGRHFDEQTTAVQGDLHVTKAKTYWDNSARPPLAPSTDKVPLIEEGKSVLSYGPDSVAKSHESSAIIYLTA